MARKKRPKPREWTFRIVAQWFDAEGDVGLRLPRIRISQKYKPILDEIQDFLAGQRIRSSIEKNPRTGVWRLIVGGSGQTKKLADRIAKYVRTPWKREHLEDLKRRPFRPPGGQLRVGPIPFDAKRSINSRRRLGSRHWWDPW